MRGRQFEYNGDQFVRLMDTVEAEGGEHLDEQCKSRVFAMTGQLGGSSRLPYCGESALFAIPYEQRHEGTNATSVGLVRVCALDDMMGLWPRYQEVMR